MPPGISDLVELKVERRMALGAVLQQMEALGERLHHAVLNGVLGHLDEMARTAGAAVHESCEVAVVIRGGQRGE